MYAGASITALADGHEFLEVFATPHVWDLVILDLMLPDLSGVEICKRLRHTEISRTVPILAMTGYDTPEMEKKVRDAGATAYLAKPFEMAEFKKVVRDLTE